MDFPRNPGEADCLVTVENVTDETTVMLRNQKVLFSCQHAGYWRSQTAANLCGGAIASRPAIPPRDRLVPWDGNVTPLKR